MIPKTIHYCWFGGNPLPKLAKKCIKSWKKYCPDYEIIEWNEDNFDISSAPLYVRQAYEAKKWAFVTDYVRLYAMTTFGGIYMDTDVEVVASLDPFLSHQAFSGFESNGFIPTGLMACEMGFSLFLEFLQYYDTAKFIKDDGTLDMTTNVIIMTDICLQHGLIPNGQFQEVAGFALYPPEVFCPMDNGSGKLNMTDQSVAIHWFNGSWLTKEDEDARKARRKKRKALDRKEFFRYLPNRIILQVLGPARYDRLKQWILSKKS